MCRHFTIEAKEQGHLEVYPGIHLNLKQSPYDITPGKPAPALILTADGMKRIPLFFGVESHGKLIYNARNETVNERILFRDAFDSHRAVFPCSVFYEVDRHCQERLFRFQDGLGYLAGFYLDDRFVILTREPTEADIRRNHPRMPLAIEKEAIGFYLSSASCRDQIMLLSQPKLTYQHDEMQLSLF